MTIMIQKIIKLYIKGGSILKKRTLNKILGFILLFISILTVGNDMAFSEGALNTDGGNNHSIEMEEGQNLTKPIGLAETFELLDVRLYDMFEEEEWLLEYKIKDKVIEMFLLEDNLRNIEENLFFLEEVKLKIKTQGVKNITLINKNEKHNIDKTITKSYTEWEEGILFPEFGVEYGEVDIENPPILIFHTEIGEDISYKLNFREGELPFKLEISLTAGNPYDKTATGGIVKYDEDGEEKFISFGHYEIGDTVTIKAIDGEKSEFKKWWSGNWYQNPPEGHDPSKYIMLEDFIGDITKNELTFTINEKFKNLKDAGGKDRLSIIANFDTFSKIYINTSEPTNNKLIATVDRDVVPTGEQFTIEAKSEDENLVFDRWEMDPIITGYQTDNPNVNLEMNKLTLNMPNLANSYELENSHRLNVTAHFKERDKEPEIEKIEPIKIEISEELPNKISIVTTNNETVEVGVKQWRTENIDLSQPGKYTVKALIDWNSKEREVEVNITVEDKTEEKRKYTINFNTNGGNAMPSIEVEEGQKLIKPTDPTKEGHKFIGWYEDSNLTKEFSFATPITKDITLYAKWEEEQLQEILEIKSVELIKDGKIISKGIIKGKTITLELPEGFDESIIGGKHILKITGTEGTNISQDRGYDGSIEEWATGKVTNSIMPGQSAKFTIYKDDNSVEYIIEIVESTVKKYTVTFNTNGGNNISSIEVEEGEKLIKPTDPIREGYKFISWYEDLNLTKEFNFNIEITKDLTLYAKWEEEPTKEYTVNFNTNGGSIINSKKVKEGEKLSRPSDPTKVNYRFMGWYEDSNLTKVFNFDTPITKEITLYVKWEKVEKPEPEKPAEKKDAKILSFKLLGIEGSINHSTGKIYVDLPYRTSLKDLIPVIIYSEGATISPDIGMAKDFERTVRYTLSGENFNSKTYEVDVSMPREKEYEEIINRDSNWYRDRHRDSRRSRRDEKDWYEITQEIKKERLREEERKTRAEIRRDALDEVSKITAQSENIRRDLSFTQFSDYMDIRLNTIGMNDLYKNKINIPAGVLKNLKELEFDYLKYSTGLLGIKIYPSMDSPDGVYINIKPAPNEPYNNVQAQWSKIKGAGRIFEIETNSTKAGLSIEIKLEKLLPAEYIRVVKYNYMKRQFEDLAPEKWSIIDGYIHMQQVSGGIYGVIYKR